MPLTILKRLLVTLIAVGFAALFFVSVSGWSYGTILPRVALWSIALLSAGVVWGVLWLRGAVSFRVLSRLSRALLGAVWLFVFGVAALAFLQEGAVSRHLLGDAGSMVGVWMMALGALMVTMLVTALGRNEWRQLRMALVVLGVLAGLASLLGTLGDFPIGAPFDNVASLVTAMIITAGLVLWSYRLEEIKRGAMVALLALVAVATVLGTMALWEITGVERTVTGSAAQEAFLQRPWVGWGAAGVPDALYGGFDASTMVPETINDLPTFSAVYLGWWGPLVQFGIIGTALALFVVLSVLYAWHRRGADAAVPAVTFLAALAFTAIVGTPTMMSALVLVLTAGVVARPQEIENIVAQQRISPVPAVILALAGATFVWFMAIVPLQATHRIARAEEVMSKQRVAEAWQLFEPSYIGLGGHDLRLAFADAILNGARVSEEDTVFAIDTALGEMRKAEQAAPNNPLSLWRQQQLISTKLAFRIDDRFITNKEREEAWRIIMDEGRAVYDRAIMLTPNHPEPYIQRGLLAFVRGFYLQADNDFLSKALTIMPANARARWSRGLARVRYDAWAQARGDLLAAIDEMGYDYRNPLDFNYLTQTFTLRNDPQNAVRFGREWVELHPLSADARWEYAQALGAVGEEERAQEQEALAERLDPDIRERKAE